MGDRGRAMSRGHRGTRRNRDDQEQPSTSQERSRSSSQHGEPYPRRPGPPTQKLPEGYPSSARGETIRAVEHRPQPTYSETASDTASVAGSVDGGSAAPSSSLGRGAMRGRRVLPANIITRPTTLETKQGITGRPIELIANYFKLLSTTDWCLHKYRVDFSPEEDRKVVCKGLLRPHRETLGAYIFDGSTLYTSTRLPETLELTSERLGDKQCMLIKIKHTGEMTRGDHDYIQFFNIIMRKCLDYLELQLVGRNYFDAKNKVEVRDFKLELWPGYITSIRQHEEDILMCAEITHKVMRNETLLDVLIQCHEENRQDYKNFFKKQVIGVVVLTDYNNNTYRIDDVDFEVTPSSTFRKKTGEEISYVQYYRSRYNLNIREMRQPLLVSKSKPRDRRAGKEELVYLVPELCRSTGLTDLMRNNFRLMSALAQYTRVSPGDRIKKLMSFNMRLHNVPNVVSELSSWNLQLDRRLVTLTGRVLPADNIVYYQNDQVPVNNKANWTNDFRNKKLLKCGVLDNWVVIVPDRLKRDCQNFVGQMIRVASTMGFRIEQPYVREIRNDQAASYADILENIKSTSNPMLIFCVATNNRMDRYAAIKKKCCVDRPVPTQVVLAKSLQNKNAMSIATKIVIQMNCKIGGIPWSIPIPLKGLMVVGFDVCHDTNSKDKDFGAMVASLDPHFGRYFSAVSSHTSGEELSNDLSVNLCKALAQFKHYNNALPKRIVIYRDGVGEGQVPMVFSHEVQQIKNKLETVYDNADDVKLAYVIVTKKINSRLFAGNQNPPPGTVIDDVITDPTRYDFMIISQHVTQGTVTPTAYNIIYDTCGMDADKLQRLTYKLCHMYFNWSGTVRVPAPCQYAHKLAFLVAQAVHQSPDVMLETLLYFL
ncbi:piwi-like protein Siwi isoform X2 [Nasonia vitripennis]|nr:piwi-like protein Siwi isoform X2 [Nasonia vitripennis]